MIAKAHSITHLRECLAYALGKREAVEICRQNLSGETVGELCAEFRVVQSLNCHCVNNTIRIEISPSVEDGTKLSHHDWGDIVADFVKRMEFGDRQYVAILHEDKQHRHIHLLVNRIGFDGWAFNDSNISRRAARVAEQMAKERGWRTAMSVRTEKQRALQPIKDSILRAHSAVFQHGMDVRQYQSMMKSHGVSVELNKSSTTGLVTGMRYVIDEVKIKASDVARSMSYNKLFGVKAAALHAPSKTVSVSRPTKGRGEAAMSPQLSATLRNLFGTGISTDSRSELDKLRDRARDRADAIENQEFENIPEL